MKTDKNERENICNERRHKQKGEEKNARERTLSCLPFPSYTYTVQIQIQFVKWHDLVAALLHLRGSKFNSWSEIASV